MMHFDARFFWPIRAKYPPNSYGRFDVFTEVLVGESSGSKRES